MDYFCKLIGTLIVGMAAVALVVTLGVVIDGFVISKLWGWFVAPRFHLLLLTIPQAWGLALLTRHIVVPATPKINIDKAKSVGEMLQTIFNQTWRPLLISPAVALLLGWAVSKFTN